MALLSLELRLKLQVFVLLLKLSVLSPELDDTRGHLMVLVSNDGDVRSEPEVFILEFADFLLEVLNVGLVSRHVGLHFCELPSHDVEVSCKLSNHVTWLR